MDMSTDARRLRVVILENEQRTIDVLTKILPKIFDELGYDATCVPTRSATQVEDWITRDGCDVLFSDLTLGKNIKTGLDHIRKFKISYPHVFVVACSGDPPSGQEINDRAPHIFDLFVPKHGFLHNIETDTGIGWQDKFKRDFAAKFRMATDIDLSITDDVRAKIRIPHPDPDAKQYLSEADVRSLIRQCLWTGPKRDATFLPNRAQLVPLGGGRSGSLVLKVQLSASSRDIDFVPVVLKISPLERAREERANFQRYVQLILPYNWRIDVMGYGETRDWGGIAYSVAFGGKKDFVPLTEFIVNGDRKTFDLIVEMIFGASGNIWYDPKFQGSVDSLSTHYVRKYFSPDYRLNTAREGLTNFLEKCDVNLQGVDVFDIGGESFPAPWRALLERFDHSGVMTVCHGDLNSNNVIVTTDGQQITFIDFQETGRGHVFEDFVALESSVRLYFQLESSVKLNNRVLRRRIDAESMILSPAPVKVSASYIPLIPYRDLIFHIRDKARSIFPAVDRVEYLYALAAFHYRLARITDLSNAQRLRITACMFAALRSLANLHAV